MVLIPLLLWGCVAATPITGNEFSASVVPRIEKGVTTTSQILNWLGEPYHKEEGPAGETIWLYAWARAKGDPTVVPFGHRNIGNSGYQKRLRLFIRDGIVVNYTYKEGII